jgi:CMP-N-acetylneuraminic acid synthetase
MEAVGFIFARGGSKGLPGKNIRLLGGKPLIGWAIECALEVDRISRIIVSTDSKEIATISKEYGAEVPFIRPAELAMDDSPELLAWKHGISYLRESTGTIPQAMVSVPATSPLRLAVDLENCLDEYEKGLADVVITVTDAHRSPYFNMVKANPDGTYGLVNSSISEVARRQDAPVVYDMATVCYVANSEFVMNHDSIFEGRVGAVHVPVERAIDIDTHFDFQLAELLLVSRKKQ